MNREQSGLLGAPPPNVPFVKRRRKLNVKTMTREQIETILKTFQAKLDKEAGYVLPDGSNVTFHVVHDGASLAFQKLESVKFDGELLYARSSRPTLAFVTSDVFAVALEGGGPQRRPAGF